MICCYDKSVFYVSGIGLISGTPFIIPPSAIMANTPLSISCVAVVGPDDALLYIAKYSNEESDLEMDSVVFCSLDYFTQEKRNSKKEKFVGQLQMQDPKYLVWGYKVTYGYKIIILSNQIPNPAEATIKGICEKVRELMFEQFTNPFYKPFSPIVSNQFNSKVKEILSGLQVIDNN